MAFQHTITEKVTRDGQSVTSENTFTGSGQISINETIQDGQTDKLINFALDVSQIQSIYIVSDQDLTLETNDGTTPDDTINLVANKPYIWYQGSYFTNLLTTDITALYATNSSGADATLQIEVVYDATP